MPTRLSPLEETLFQTWARAHGVQNHDDPKNFFDHRGLYKQTNGLVMPSNVVKQMADTHNQTMEPQDAGASVENPDPYMAAAEMHGNQLKAQTDMKKEALKFKLEEQKHKQKVELEQMKLQHQAQQKAEDRQYKAQEQAQAREQQAQDAERNRQQDAQMMQQQRQFQVEDNQQAQQHDMQGTLMKEQLTRSRPQPTPPQGAGLPSAGSNMGQQPPSGQAPGSSMNGQDHSPEPQAEMGGQSQPSSMQASPPQESGLRSQLMQRAGAF